MAKRRSSKDWGDPGLRQWAVLRDMNKALEAARSPEEIAKERERKRLEALFRAAFTKYPRR